MRRRIACKNGSGLNRPDLSPLAKMRAIMDIDSDTLHNVVADIFAGRDLSDKMNSSYSDSLLEMARYLAWLHNFDKRSVTCRCLNSASGTTKPSKSC